MLHQKGSMAMAVMVIRKTQAITVRGALRVRAYRHSVPTFRAATTTTVRTTVKEDSVPKALHRDFRTAEDNSRVHTVRTTTITIMQRAATNLVSRHHIALATIITTMAKAAISLVSSRVAIVRAIATTVRAVISLVSSKVAIVHAITPTAKAAISLVSSRVAISHARVVTTIVEATDSSREGHRVAIVLVQPTTTQLQSIR